MLLFPHQVTSVTGTILAMDSTKQVAKKLARQGKALAQWLTNIGNEDGQIVMSVLTSGKGEDLGEMIRGLVRRYETLGEAPPQVLYVDKDCCSRVFERRFRGWPHLQVSIQSNYSIA